MLVSRDLIGAALPASCAAELAATRRDVTAASLWLLLTSDGHTIRLHVRRALINSSSWLLLGPQEVTRLPSLILSFSASSQSARLS